MESEDIHANDGAGESAASAHIEEPSQENDASVEGNIDSDKQAVAGADQSGQTDSHSGDVQERLRRADALISAKRALELADQLKLVSLNVAIESAKTRSSSMDLKRIKADLSTLTNHAVKASREIGGLITAISSGEPMVSAMESDFRKAVHLKKELEAILQQSRRVLAGIDRLESH